MRNCRSGLLKDTVVWRDNLHNHVDVRVLPCISGITRMRALRLLPLRQRVEQNKNSVMKY